MCVLVCVAPPMVVGAWSMAGVLRQLFEYYLFIQNLIVPITSCNQKSHHKQLIENDTNYPLHG